MSFKQSPGICITYILLFLWPGSYGYSQETAPKPDDTASDANLLEFPLDLIDKGQQLISTQVTTLAESLDRFFGAERLYEEDNRSYLQMNLIGIKQPGVTPERVVDVRGRVALPRTQDRLNLLIEPNQQEQDGDQTTLLRNATDSTDTFAPADYSAALRFVIRLTDELRVNLDMGIRATEILEPFVRSRVRRTHSWQKWRLNLAETFYYYSSDGFEAHSEMDWERRLDDYTLIRSSSQADWLDREGRFKLNQSFYISNRINWRTGVVHRLSIIGYNEDPAAIDQYQLSFKLRRRLHRPWIFFQLEPLFLFNRNDNFSSSPAMLASIEMLFGYTSDNK